MTKMGKVFTKSRPGIIDYDRNLKIYLKYVFGFYIYKIYTSLGHNNSSDTSNFNNRKLWKLSLPMWEKPRATW